MRCCTMEEEVVCAEGQSAKAGYGPAAHPEEYKRIKSIDRFRGFCVACMLIFQFMYHFPSLGFLQRIAMRNVSVSR